MLLFKSYKNLTVIEWHVAVEKFLKLLNFRVISVVKIGKIMSSKDLLIGYF